MLSAPDDFFISFSFIKTGDFLITVDTKHFIGDDSVYDDLKISKDEYPKVPTTW